jgi:hypothetical protein
VTSIFIILFVTQVNKMATISNERHLRYILLLGEGGTLVLKEILERETVKSSKSLGNLLDANKNALTRRIEKHILPKVFGPDANQDAWDIQLLSTVILQLFKKSLTKDENNCITKLKELMTTEKNLLLFLYS